MIGAILDAAQLLLDVAGLLKDLRTSAESDGAAGLVLLNIHGNRQSLTERDATPQRQDAARNAE